MKKEAVSMYRYFSESSVYRVSRKSMAVRQFGYFAKKRGKYKDGKLVTKSSVSHLKTSEVLPKTSCCRDTPLTLSTAESFGDAAALK
jgi:hypothetical protein